MRKFTRTIAAAALVATVPRVLLAADAPAPAPPAAPSLLNVLSTSGIDLHGYVDAAYSYLSGTGQFTSGVADRVFDTEPNSFNLQQAALTVDYLPKDGFGALVNLTAGRDARIIQSAGESSSNFDVTQAFVQYGRGPITIIGGKYVTLAGAEFINSTADSNYSRSILFGYAIPFTHTGVRLTYAVSGQLSVIAGVNNGWDQIADSNKQKTGELGVAYTPNKLLSLAVQGYSGNEQLSTGSYIGAGLHGRRDLVDGVVTYNATSKLTFILNVDWADQDNATSLIDGSTIKAQWGGAAGYANYQFTDQWAVSLRAEYFDDRDGFRTGVIQQWKEATATLRYMPSAKFELRAEGRYDLSNGSTFVSSGAEFTTPGGLSGTGKNQYSLGLEAIFKF